MKTFIEKMEHKIKGLESEIISELAFERVDEDWLSKEQIIEQHEEEIGEIESRGDPQDDENYIWDNWYANGYAQGFRNALDEIKTHLKEESKKRWAWTKK